MVRCIFLLGLTFKSTELRIKAKIGFMFLNLIVLITALTNKELPFNRYIKGFSNKYVEVLLVSK